MYSVIEISSLVFTGYVMSLFFSFVYHAISPYDTNYCLSFYVKINSTCPIILKILLIEKCQIILWITLYKVLECDYVFQFEWSIDWFFTHIMSVVEKITLFLYSIPYIAIYTIAVQISEFITLKLFKQMGFNFIFLSKYYCADMFTEYSTELIL